MANSPSPWSVKGVEPEAREAAKIAARKAGLTVGAWLTQMIRQSASDQLRSGGSASTAPETGYYDQPYPRNRPSQRSAAPDEQYFSGNENWQPPPQQDGYGNTQQPPPGSAPPPAPTMQAVFEGIQRLSSRIESAEQRTADTIAPIVEKVAQLSEQLENAKGGGSASTAPVERAVQKIAERLDRMENGPAPDFTRLPAAQYTSQIQYGHMRHYQNG
jgi:localization factor PodJL